MLLSMAIARILNSFTKLTACVYRPWVADSKIKPFKGALADATGYSLPSGHFFRNIVRWKLFERKFFKRI